MSPELLHPEQPGYSFENDIWAVGIIMYTMLFGFEPFNAETKESIVMNIQKACLQFPEEILVSNAAKELLRKILRRNPRKFLIGYMIPIF